MWEMHGEGAACVVPGPGGQGAGLGSCGGREPCWVTPLAFGEMGANGGVGRGRECWSAGAVPVRLGLRR